MLRHVSRLLQLRRAYVGLPLAIRPLAVARGYSTGTGIAIDKIRNVAIIAHVDHGKTTLVDQLLKQSGTFLAAVAEAEAVGAADTSDRVMDSNALERERGITILSKCTSIRYNDNLINIVDTPGHADFSGEVERVLSMVDGVVLVVCGTEGVMTQTRFVLRKALAMRRKDPAGKSKGLKVVVVLNKADRPTARLAKVEEEVFELFVGLGADDEQIDYEVLYASAKEGWATKDSSLEKRKDMTELFEEIVQSVPAPTLAPETTDSSPFSMLTVQLDTDPYLGTLSLGRIHSGSISIGSPIITLDPEGKKAGEGRVKKIFRLVGLDRVEIPSAATGEIVMIATSIRESHGVGVNLTICSPEGTPTPLETTPIDPPTISTIIYPNDSPLAGQSDPNFPSAIAPKLTSQLIKDRIYKESLTNVALKVLPGPTSESLELRGRGVLHLGILFEEMRREGFEFLVGPPKAVLLPNPEHKPGDKSAEKWLEPIEEVTVLVKAQYAGVVVEKLTLRKGEMTSYEAVEAEGIVPGASSETGGENVVGDWVRIEMDVPARGLIGYMAGEFKNDVHGEGTINHTFKAYLPYKGAISTGRNGALISMATGQTSAYAIVPLQARGIMFISPQTPTYAGQVIGEASKALDMYVNPTAKKQLTNIRAAGADEKLVVTPARLMGLEECIAYVGEDELVEVTRPAIRLRKVELDMGKRMKNKNNRQAASY